MNAREFKMNEIKFDANAIKFRFYDFNLQVACGMRYVALLFLFGVFPKMTNILMPKKMSIQF